MEVAVIGGGIVGCAAAALLAETGASVTLYERERIGAGASGRNQGVLQHPMDDVLAPLYRESLELHHETAPHLGLDRPPDGLLFVSHHPALPHELAGALAVRYPELEPVLLEDARMLEPGLAPGIAACRVETGHQIPPQAATEAWAERARAAGARLVGTDPLEPVGTDPLRGQSPFAGACPAGRRRRGWPSTPSSDAATRRARSPPTDSADPGRRHLVPRRVAA